MRIKNYISKSREQLDKISDLFPVFCFIGSTLCLLNIISFHEFPVGTEIQHAYIDFWLKHFLDTSFILILLMFTKSKTYRWFSWMCLLCCFGVWIANTVFVGLGIDRDIYFAVVCSIIYVAIIIFVLLRTVIRQNNK